MEKLFTADEITAITKEATDRLDEYLNTHVISGEATETSIITITALRQLIFTEGNEDTGYGHLRDRHSMYSVKNYWVGQKLDDPSKFHPKMMPIVDFIKIAEAVFVPENKNITKNNHPDQFDKYTGNYNYSGDLNEKYHLLTYKDTKIVHTLFPDKKRYNRKRKLQFGKGIVTSELKFPMGHSDLRVPYENSQGIVAYSILIRKYFEEQVERTFIQKHDDLGNPADVYLIGEGAIEGFEPFDRPIMYRYQYTDLRDYEAIIRQIDESYLPSKA